MLNLALWYKLPATNIIQCKFETLKNPTSSRRPKSLTVWGSENTFSIFYLLCYKLYYLQIWNLRESRDLNEASGSSGIIADAAGEVEALVKQTRKWGSVESQIWSETVRSETALAWSREIVFSSRGWLSDSRRDVAELGGTALSSVSLWPDAKLKYLFTINLKHLKKSFHWKHHFFTDMFHPISVLRTSVLLLLMSDLNVNVLLQMK